MIAFLQGITLEQWTFAIAAFLAIWNIVEAALKFIAPRTQTTIDDKILGYMVKAEAKAIEAKQSKFIADNAPKFFEFVEACSKNAKLGSAQKLAMYIGMLHAACKEAMNAPLSLAATQEAEARAAFLAEEAKKAPTVSVP